MLWPWPRRAAASRGCPSEPGSARPRPQLRLSRLFRDTCLQLLRQSLVECLGLAQPIARCGEQPQTVAETLLSRSDFDGKETSEKSL